MKYAIIIEQTSNGYSAYVPDLPGCVAAADWYEDTEKLIREAVALHVESIREYGDPIPEPGTSVGMLEVEAYREPWGLTLGTSSGQMPRSP